MRKLLLFLFVSYLCLTGVSQNNLAPTPPMGFMTWNYFGCDIHEKDIKEIAEAMIENGLVELGYNHIFIDDCWQGGRDNKNNIIEDKEKFPSGIKALADYLHDRGMKLGIYSDAALLTCAGYTASLNFEEQDAKTFASWGVDYLKYDYCGAPSDVETAKKRYKKMADALKKTGRDITFSICEWGDRKPWLWGTSIGGNLWRTTGDVRDKWASYAKTNKELHGQGAGILDIVNINAELNEYAGPSHWNDPDMLVVGLYGKKGPSGDLGGIGCTDTEYQSQMSLWCLMASPLMITNDVRNMNHATKAILTNKEILKINQDVLGRQATRKINKDNWQVFLKPLLNGDFALGILNVSDQTRTFKLDLKDIGLEGKYQLDDVWQENEKIRKKNKIKLDIASHETIVYRLSK